jgi:hypothetical protein
MIRITRIWWFWERMKTALDWHLRRLNELWISQKFQFVGLSWEPDVDRVWDTRKQENEEIWWRVSSDIVWGISQDRCDFWFSFARFLLNPYFFIHSFGDAFFGLNLPAAAYSHWRTWYLEKSWTTWNHLTVPEIKPCFNCNLLISFCSHFFSWNISS